MCFEDKECAFCGGRLQYIDIYGGFWGCENYKTIQGTHISFSGRKPIIKPKADVPRDILGKILTTCGLSKKIKYKPLYEFIIGTGREDLRLKYGYTSMENLFNGYEKANINSKKQEEAALSHLKSMWDIVIPQQCIEYKYTDSAKKICFPDFICSNNAYVTVVDAKLWMTNDEQIDLYVSLISHIMKQKGDNRTVTGAYIVYDNDFGVPATESKYRLIRI
jgi:ssDNA-binding Zn-finger/Zn-ribbon topoisomerase 1